MQSLGLGGNADVQVSLEDLRHVREAGLDARGVPGLELRTHSQTQSVLIVGIDTVHPFYQAQCGRFAPLEQ